MAKAAGKLRTSHVVGEQLSLCILSPGVGASATAVLCCCCASQQESRYLKIQLCAQRQQQLEAPVVPQRCQDVNEREARLRALIDSIPRWPARPQPAPPLLHLQALALGQCYSETVGP